MQTKRPSRQRKHLKLTDDEFFTLATLKFGNPTLAPFNYMSMQHPDRIRGLRFWCRETPEGRAFVELVSQCGEAKARAASTYRRWVQWHKDRIARETIEAHHNGQQGDH